MKILIAPGKKIGEIQDEFSEEFPFLRLVFFSKPHKAFKGSPAKYMVLQTDKFISQLQKGVVEGELNLEPEMPTWQVERLFEEDFGLFVQVFRKSGDTWLLTSVTDDLTLEQQNAKGRASEHVHFESKDPLDYREQE